MTLRVFADEETFYPMAFDGHKSYSVSFTVPMNPQVLWYDFLIQTNSGEISYGAQSDYPGGEGCIQGFDRRSFQVTVYDPGFQTPEYMHGAQIYQIFPDRFYKAPTRAVCLRQDRYLHAKWDETPILMPDPETRNVNIAADFLAAPSRVSSRNCLI